MDLFSIFQVQIDVCETHGIWFDANELAQVLLRAARST
jgi:Zn-finger nucleic acid-binding protein